MKQQAYFMALLLAGTVSAAPTSNETDDFKMTLSDQFFDESLVVYTSEYDIVSLLLPLNALNFDSETIDNENSFDTVLFFVEADTENEEKIYKGLYVRKDGEVTKLLDNGRGAAAANENTRIVYFGASDGLYSYNEEENKAEKYGTITDSIIGIAKATGNDVIYILTDDYQLYKVTEDGTKKEKIEEAIDVRKIVLDFDNNLYYYTGDKDVYVLVEDGVEKIEGLPIAESYIDILTAPFLMKNRIPVIIDDKAYIAYADGSSELSDLDLQVRPTAYTLEATLLQYIAYNKKIYEYNVLNLLYIDLPEDIQVFLENKLDYIARLASDLKK